MAAGIRMQHRAAPRQQQRQHRKRTAGPSQLMCRRGRWPAGGLTAPRCGGLQVAATAAARAARESPLGGRHWNWHNSGWKRLSRLRMHPAFASSLSPLVCQHKCHRQLNSINSACFLPPTAPVVSTSLLRCPRHLPAQPLFFPYYAWLGRSIFLLGPFSAPAHKHSTPACLLQQPLTAWLARVLHSTSEE